jgi:hypothetical protein
MSVLTTLALMSTALVAKLRPNPDVENTRLQARVDDLERQLDEAKAVAVRLGRERDTLREMLSRWQGRAEQQVPAGPNFMPVHQINEATRQHMMMQAQAQQQSALAQMNGQNFNQDIFGQQALGQYSQEQALQDDAMFCNCVPARHDMFTGFLGRSRDGS